MQVRTGRNNILPAMLCAALSANACTEMAAPAEPSPIAAPDTQLSLQATGDDQSALAAGSRPERHGTVP